MSRTTPINLLDKDEPVLNMTIKPPVSSNAKEKLNETILIYSTETKENARKRKKKLKQKSKRNVAVRDLTLSPLNFKSWDYTPADLSKYPIVSDEELDENGLNVLQIGGNGHGWPKLSTRGDIPGEAGHDTTTTTTTEIPSTTTEKIPESLEKFLTNVLTIVTMVCMFKITIEIKII